MLANPSLGIQVRDGFSARVRDYGVDLDQVDVDPDDSWG
jgi:hypothetical protein